MKAMILILYTLHAILKQYNIGSSAQTKTSFSHVVLLSGTTCTVITSVLWIPLLVLGNKTEVRNLAEIQPWIIHQKGYLQKMNNVVHLKLSNSTDMFVAATGNRASVNGTSI